MENEKCFRFEKSTQTITGNDVSKGGTDVRVPDNIEGVKVLHIGDGAFANMGLTSLVVPDNLFSIGKGVIDSNNIKSISVNTDVKLENAQLRYGILLSLLIYYIYC